MKPSRKYLALKIGTVLAVAVAGYFIWDTLIRTDSLPEGFASGNGRIEAVELDIASKYAGRVLEVYVDEGDFVSAGQLLATMDTAVQEAELREAQAQLQRALIGVETAGSLVTQREAAKDAAGAVIAQRQAELNAAEATLGRTQELVDRGTAAAQTLDTDRASYESARAALSGARAELAAAEAGIGYARSEVIGAEADVEAARATIARIEVTIDDSVLMAPRDGRVQYRVAQPGEVVAAGGIVLNMIDLGDVYMNFYLPTAVAGRLRMGAEARIVLDAAPQYVIPATISYVADVAQFTPRSVETANEREKLMFRVKAQIPVALLQAHMHDVKTGLPGMAYMRLDPQAEWPQELQASLPGD